MSDQVLEPQLLKNARATGARETTCRMFANEVLERFSRIHPATPFVAWVPVGSFFLLRSLLRHRIGALEIGALVLGGVLTWTLAEYVLHKYVFHWINDTNWGRRAHFLLHGVHHEYPGDRDRLVMPLLTSVPLAVLFYALFSIVMGHTLGDPFFTGFVVGYLFYDGTHFYVHHFVPTTRWGKFLRRHHLTHHFADHDGGFGVSSPLWDLIFQTMPAKKK
jgi:sterol desaturase/sphingolipid hydroxylase (fatty acid hydroxylase superfamily)